MENKTVIIGRSSDEAVNIGNICSMLGGGGHSGAGSAQLKENLAAAVNKLKSILQKRVRPGLKINEIMSTPVKTVSSDTSIKEVEKKLESMHDDKLKAKTGEGFEAPYSTYVLKQNIIDGYMVQFHYNENKELVWVKLGYSLDGDEDGEERYREDKCNNTYEEAKNKITSKYGKYNAGGPKNRKSYMWSDEKQWIFQNGNVIALQAQNVRNVEECSIKVNYYHSSIMEKEENDF